MGNIHTQGERLEVSSEVIFAAKDAALRAYPNEACGIILGDGARITSFIETPNIHPSPQTHFEIDPQALIDAHRTERTGGPCVMGYFHSHPTGDPAPSETDRAMAAGDGKIWAIVTGDEVRFWRDFPNNFEALSYAILER